MHPKPAQFRSCAKFNINILLRYDIGHGVDHLNTNPLHINSCPYHQFKLPIQFGEAVEQVVHNLCLYVSITYHKIIGCTAVYIQPPIAVNRFYGSYDQYTVPVKLQTPLILSYLTDHEVILSLSKKSSSL